jgi:hypothetical protein
MPYHCVRSRGNLACHGRLVVLAIVALVAAAIPLSAAEPRPLKPQPAATTPDEPPNEPAVRPRDLGPPLVDEINDLRRLHPAYPVWLDGKRKQVVLQGEVCRANYPLEFLATYPPRGYESLLTVAVKPSIVHAALLRLGAEAGHPARFEPQFEPPTGTEVAVDIRWRDKDGKRHESSARDWVKNVKTGKPLEVNWVFAGSSFWKDESTGKELYQADAVGDFISVLNLPTATLDLPIRSQSAIESRLFEGFVEHLPPENTPVTIILQPKLKTVKPDASR